MPQIGIVELLNKDGNEVLKEGNVIYKIAGVSLDTVPYAEKVEMMGSIQDPKP